MTVKGKFDNNQGLSVEADDINDVARGFFWRDASYGFQSLDGFVVKYKAESQTWDYISLTLSTFDFKPDQTDLDLTTMRSDGNWDCIVEIDPSPTPLWNEATCSRVIPVKSDYETQMIRYQPGIIMEPYGYMFDGIDRSIWEFGGQV